MHTSRNVSDVSPHIDRVEQDYAGQAHPHQDRAHQRQVREQEAEPAPVEEAAALVRPVSAGGPVGQGPPLLRREQTRRDHPPDPAEEVDRGL